MLQRVAAVALFGWCLIMALSALAEARRRPRDAMAALDAQFSSFARQLPPTGEVGILEPRVGAGKPEAVRLHYAAQYALAPRLVVEHAGPEFVIVPAGALDGDDDPRLTGYVRIAAAPGGHRLYRRFR